MSGNPLVNGRQCSIAKGCAILLAGCLDSDEAPEKAAALLGALLAAELKLKPPGEAAVLVA